jgi:hypothetical protein
MLFHAPLAGLRGARWFRRPLFLLGVDMPSVRDTALHLHSRELPTSASAGESHVAVIRLTAKLLSMASAAPAPFPKLLRGLS